MTKTRFAFALLTLLAVVSIAALAQTLPAGDARNDQFRAHFQEVVRLNPQVRDFYRMQEGQVYLLPDGRTDTLETGDTRGIWGREYGKFYNNPVTSGPAIVPGGIQPNETQRLNDYFDREALSRHATRVGPVESGTIVGDGTIGYANGEERPYHVATPLRAYRARFRMQDGTEKTFITLQGCMNPVNSGGEVYQGFVFNSDQNQQGGVNNDPPPPPAPGWFSTHKKIWVPGLIFLLAALAVAPFLVRRRRLSGIAAKAEIKTEVEPAGDGLHPWRSPTGKVIAVKPPRLVESPAHVAQAQPATEVPVVEASELPRVANNNPLDTPDGAAVLAASTEAKSVAADMPGLGETSPVVPEATQKPARTFISYAPADDGKPEMVKFNGVELHSLDFESDGTTTIRFSRK